MRLHYANQQCLGKEQLGWKQGLHATAHLPNGDKYVGEWKDDMRHGKGTYYFTKTLSVYEGKFQNNHPNGFGILSVPIKPQKGDIRPDIFSSSEVVKEKIITKNFDPLPPSKLKKMYVGEWVDGMKDGYGTFFFDDGSVYEGQWKANTRQGWGKMNYVNKQIYEGEWHADKRHGQGVLVNDNGDRYEGTFMKDKKEGPGRFIYLKKRQMYEGEWLNDVAKCGCLIQFPNSQPEHPFPVIQLTNYRQVLENSYEQFQIERESQVIPN